MVALEHLLDLLVPTDTAGFGTNDIDEPLITGVILDKYHLALILSTNHF
jgi:hypothetical protein